MWGRLIILDLGGPRYSTPMAKFACKELLSSFEILGPACNG